MLRSTDELLPAKPEARLRIYAYSIDDPAHAGLLKVGQTTQEVKARVAQQLKTAAIKNFKIVLDESAEAEDGSLFSDHDVRSRLKAKGDAAMDLRARSGGVLAPGGGRGLFPTGIALALPPAWAALILPRSGLALKHGVTCINAPGLIDSGSRGEVQVAVVNTDPDIPFVVRRGDRIAQVMFQWLERPEWLEVDRLDETERGSRGFGSSGL